MTNVTATYDSEAARSLISFWLRRVTNTNALSIPDSPDSAAFSAVSDDLKALDCGGECATTSAFLYGVEFGVNLALAVVADPLSPSNEEGVQNAISIAREALKAVLADQRSAA